MSEANSMVRKNTRKERNFYIKRRLTKIVKLEELEEDFRLKISGKSEKTSRYYRIYKYKKSKIEESQHTFEKFRRKPNKMYK